MATYKKRGFKKKPFSNKIEDIGQKSATANVFNTLDEGASKTEKWVADNLVVIAQIEHIDAVNNLEAIVKVEGLDAIMIGPYDLSASLGITGEFENKKYKDVLTKILEVCAKQKMPCGIHVVQPDTKMLEQRIREGYTFIAYGVDTVFLNNGASAPK